MTAARDFANYIRTDHTFIYDEFGRMMPCNECHTDYWMLIVPCSYTDGNGGTRPMPCVPTKTFNPQEKAHQATAYAGPTPHTWRKRQVPNQTDPNKMYVPTDEKCQRCKKTQAECYRPCAELAATWKEEQKAKYPS